MPYVDYSVDSFCSNCSKPRPQDIIFCPVCHHRVRHYKRFKGEKKGIGVVVPTTKEAEKGNVFDETWYLRCLYEK